MCIRDRAAGYKAEASGFSGHPWYHGDRKLSLIHIYAQIFALEESVFYNLYREKADSLHGEIYIVNGSGELISTSDEKSLESCTVPGYLKDILSSRSDETFEIKRDGENKLVSRCV